MRLRAALPALCLRIKTPDALIDVIRAVGATLEPADIAAAIVERARTWVPASSWTLVSTDLSGNLSTLASTSLSPLAPGLSTLASGERSTLASGERSTLADHAIPPGLDSWVHGVARWVMERDELFATADLRHDPRLPTDAEGSVIALPLISRDAPIGALVGADSRPSARAPRMTPAALGALQLLLEPAAAALEKAVLLKRAEALSVTDDLTHLHNSRSLNQLLHKETKRAARGGRPLSLLFIDLDGFKSINDTYGHLSGSRALVEAGAVIRSGARETDIVARFGGDEFALVLPDTGPVGALAVAERIRERIARHEFLAADGLAIRLTGSVGVATLPDVAASADGLVQAADAAMYQVKARGKNGIQAAAVPADR